MGGRGLKAAGHVPRLLGESTMGLALRLYEQLTETTDERVRLRLIADAIGELEESWPRAGEIARSSDVRESELRLQREIEVVRKEIEVVRKEIEVVRRETKEAELNLQKEIKAVELSLKKEIEVVRKEIKDVELSMRTAMHQHTLWVIGAVGTVVGLVKLLDWLLA
jgi:preprotein translocase subunit SecE